MVMVDATKVLPVSVENSVGLPVPGGNPLIEETMMEDADKVE
jgi:hypothetical protein